MRNTLSKSPSKTRPKTTFQPQASTFPPSTKEKANKSHSFSSLLPERRTPNSSPLAIGTRGTVGSLIKQEIEYFRGLEVDGCSSSSKLPCQPVDVASTVESSRSKLEPVTTIAGTKKRGSNRLIPRMCSTVEVANQPNTYSVLNYKNQKADDLKELQP